MSIYVCECGSPLYVVCGRPTPCCHSPTPLPRYIEAAEARQRERICRLLEGARESGVLDRSARAALVVAVAMIRRREDERL